MRSYECVTHVTWVLCVFSCDDVFFYNCGDQNAGPHNVNHYISHLMVNTWVKVRPAIFIYGCGSESLLK